MANVTTQLVHKSITVRQNKVTELPPLTWKMDSRKKIFQIGAFDRKTLGFTHGGAPYQHGLAEQSPANLTYTIGQSKESDWHFAQSSIGTWTIRFSIEDSSFLTEGSAAVLSVALAGYSKGADMRISVNSRSARTLRGNDIASDPALYRSGTTAGESHLFEIELGKGLLKRGWNEVGFEIVATKLWKGFMWDAIWMVWK
jgi:rhamnogalacturonan endolyase